MSKILELREKRAKAWDAAKAFWNAMRTRAGEGLDSVERNFDISFYVSCNITFV